MQTTEPTKPAEAQSFLTDELERISSTDDCCRWCKSGWCTKHGTCEHEIPTEDEYGNHSGMGCGLAL